MRIKINSDKNLKPNATKKGTSLILNIVNQLRIAKTKK
jgi:hypothetical protein